MSQNPRILIVDDERAARLIIQAILKETNYITVCAESGEEALEILADDPGFDVILLDYLMIGLDGIDVLKSVKANDATKDIRVIMASALSEPEEMVEAFEAGASDYIIKPLNPIELKARLETQIKLYHAQK